MSAASSLSEFPVTPKDTHMHEHVQPEHFAAGVRVARSRSRCPSRGEGPGQSDPRVAREHDGFEA